MDWLETAGSAIGGVVAAIVAVGGLLGAIGRLSQVARARRRVNQAAALEKEAHDSLRDLFAALHAEESARYLAVVESRNRGAGVQIVVAICGALLGAVVILTSMAVNASESHIGSETATVVLPFGIACIALTGYALDKVSARHDAFIRAYRRNRGDPDSEISKLKVDLHKLVSKVGENAVRSGLVLGASLFVTLFFALSGHLAGRSFTEGGREMLASDGTLVTLLVRVTLLASVIIAAACGAFLFPGLPRSGDSLRSAADAMQSESDAVDSDPKETASSADLGEQLDASDAIPSPPK